MERHLITHRIVWTASLALTLLIGQTACTHVAPTIAHTHIGHAITGFDGTPDSKGLLVVAEERGDDALALMDRALAETNDAITIKRLVGDAVELTISNDFGLKVAIAEADSHIEFAARSNDASKNLQSATDAFSTGANTIQQRCDLIALLGNDVQQLDEPDEVRVLTQQIRELAHANVHGEDVDGDGRVGTSAPEFGLHQLRANVDALVAKEDPPYVTIDRWYLFHLVRLPNCDNCWAWRKWANSSNRGY